MTGNSDPVSGLKTKVPTAELSAKERVVQRVLGCDPPPRVQGETPIQQVYETGDHLHFVIL